MSFYVYKENEIILNHYYQYCYVHILFCWMFFEFAIKEEFLLLYVILMKKSVVINWCFLFL